jgi:hypothetical protein
MSVLKRSIDVPHGGIFISINNLNMLLSLKNTVKEYIVVG